jgi:hypothetical protein
MGGLPVFRGTRVPARALLDYLADGDSLDTCLDDFPSVRPRPGLCAAEEGVSGMPASDAMSKPV